ncbi:MAG TPA: NRDE family protein [Deltaproteobacteria bacterium]|nr:NRDE family protein [Deltaproteobacteria bacterium]
MCTVLFSFKSHPEYPLILASNRDEFHDRPTMPAAFWDERFDLLAGRDLKACGTWLGITKTGRFATLTNFRAPASMRDDAPTRGKLVSNFLLSEKSPETYFHDMRFNAHEYNGFNLLFGYVSELYYFSNKDHGFCRKVAPGLYGLSNHLFDTPWPKVERGKKLLSDVMSGGKSITAEMIFGVLADTYQPDDSLLPDTGVGPKWERILAPIFVQSPAYGTQFSTVIMVDTKNRVSFTERAFQSRPDQYTERTFEFSITDDNKT